MKSFNGKVLFLDRSDINTDEIIPAKYLTEISKDALKPHLLEDLSLEEFNPQTDITGKNIIVSRSNFGCGSSREHAPWALEVNGIHLVIAESFARIFRQNTYNNGMMAVALPVETIDRLFSDFSDLQTTLETDLDEQIFIFRTADREEHVPFNLAGFDRELVKAGGWVEYADRNY
ncbi:MAG: 3-isopropylmalate dehydratase small subunit [Deltaproteobacteria bacterium]|nr:MAG: 3-isopropylmalate dehydratase small subunit [Deltaproteobacteria bacterium]RLC17002.1 MAG: 3-isopropylmalate dehydratase small subunit [Deltaproteobacteria bacterium]HHE73945.1 3-isopropylmalate dehydratase small subunit [Desulfobacteraceae bacterium]